MELWIRNQNKDRLVKCNSIDILDRNQRECVSNMLSNMKIKPFKMDIMLIANDSINLGTYKTKERTLEILDEIAAMIKNRYIVRPSGILSTKDMANEHIRLNILYNGEFIMENPPFEIEPINSNVIYYEMPEE